MKNLPLDGLNFKTNQIAWCSLIIIKFVNTMNVVYLALSEERSFRVTVTTPFAGHKCGSCQ